MKYIIAEAPDGLSARLALHKMHIGGGHGAQAIMG